MFRRLLPTVSALVLLPVAPAAAQEAEPALSDEARIVSSLQQLYQAEPLTPEQEARVPAAQGLATLIVPDGLYNRMMDDLLGTILTPIAGIVADEGLNGQGLADRLGLPAEQLGALPQETRREITTLLDPAFEQRADVLFSSMREPMMQAFQGIEPVVRQGIARAYAVRFTDAQLADIGAFFATPTGAVYASESLLAFSDRQVMSASMELVPRMMELMPQMMERMQAAMAELPAERRFADLSAEQRRRLAELVGTDVATLKTSMADAPITTKGAQ